MINPMQYDHAGYIASAYGLFVATTLWFALGARMRLVRTAARLRAADPRVRAVP
jgi:hypothetical protein